MNGCRIEDDFFVLPVSLPAGRRSRREKCGFQLRRILAFVQPQGLLGKTLWLSLLTSLLAGCMSAGHNNEKASLEAEVAQLLDSLTPLYADESSLSTEQAAPQLATWLDNSFEARFRDNARAAILTVLQGRPAVFDLATAENPQVISSPEARTIREHLQAIVTQAGWFFVVRDDVLIVSDSATRRYSLNAMPATVSASFGIGGEDSVGRHDIELLSTPYVDLESTVSQLVAEAEAKAVYSFLPTANTLVVTGPPGLQRDIAMLVREYNQAIARKIHLVITVYDVSFSDSSARSVDLDIFREAAIAASASFQGSKLIQPSADGLSLNLDFLEGNSVNASSLIFRLLEQQGHTTVKLHEAFEASNNVVTSIQDHRIQPYVSQVSLARQDGGSFTSLTPTIETASVSTGLGFDVLATVIDDEISVRLRLSQSDLVRFENYAFGSGDNSISGRLPVTDAQQRLIPMSLRDGETRLIANLTQTQFRNSDSKGLFGFGGAATSRNQMEKQTVIAVTARLL